MRAAPAIALLLGCSFDYAELRGVPAADGDRGDAIGDVLPDAGAPEQPLEAGAEAASDLGAELPGDAGNEQGTEAGPEGGAETAPEAPPEAPAPDGPPGACTTAPQAGCPAGQRCAFQADYCRPKCFLAGTAIQGAPCTAGTGGKECAPGYECVATPTDSYCARYCSSPTDCEAGWTCKPAYRPPGVTCPAWSYCART